MSVTPTHAKLTLKKLLDQLDNGTIQINRKYQRSGQIWPTRAKSFLVETVLVGMPIPRVLLHKLNPATPPHHSDIIDGQQRCTILQEYRQNGFELSGDVDHAKLQGR